MRLVETPSIRRLFVPRDGYCLFEADMKRADPQIVAKESDEESLLQAFRDGADVYTDMGKWLYNLHHLSQEQRQWNKNAINGTNYAAQAKTMATTLHTTQDKAARYIERWRGPTGLYPGIGKWHRRVDAQLLKAHTVRNVYGFRRFYTDRHDNLLPKALAWIASCVPLDCEVLTLEGWKTIEESMQTNEDIAIWDNKEIRFEKPTAWTKNKTGLLVHLERLGYSCTPNHRIPYYLSKSPEQLRVNRADNLPLQARVPRTGLYKDGKVCLSKAQIRFIVAFQADGSFDEKRNAIAFEFRRERKIERLEGTLQELGATYTRTLVRRNSTMFYIKFANKLVDPRMKRYGPWLLDLSGDNLDYFLNEIQFWDGHKPSILNGELISYTQTYKSDCDWIATIACLRGFRSHVHSITRRDGRHKQPWFVSIPLNGGKKTQPIVYHLPLIEEIDVACPTVSSGFFLIRSLDGEISITGNSAVSVTINRGMKHVFGPNMYGPCPYYDENGTPQTTVKIEERDRYDPWSGREYVALPQIQLLLQIHDSIIGQFPAEMTNEIVPKIIERMEVEIPYEKPLVIPVTLKVGAKGTAWGDLPSWKESA